MEIRLFSRVKKKEQEEVFYLLFVEEKSVKAWVHNSHPISNMKILQMRMREE